VLFEMGFFRHAEAFHTLKILSILLILSKSHFWMALAGLTSGLPPRVSEGTIRARSLGFA